jgi:hypothetical protein
LGRQAIEAVLAMEESLEGHKETMRILEDSLSDATGDAIEVGIQLRQSRASCTRLTHSIRLKRAALGVAERTALQRLKGNIFLRTKMNARAVKWRLRDRLRQRKFELERLERSYRLTVNGKYFSSDQVVGATE